MKDRPHIFWLRDPDTSRSKKGGGWTNGKPIACVASRLTEPDSSGTRWLTFAVATHNFHDPFKRHIGLNKAIGRLNAHQMFDKTGRRHHFELEIKKDEDIRERVLEAIQDDKDAFGISASLAAAKNLKLLLAKKLEEIGKVAKSQELPKFFETKKRQ